MKNRTKRPSPAKGFFGIHAALALLLYGPAFSRAAAECPAALDSQNVVWHSPSTNASGSMPLGNGELGMNAWVDQRGDLLLYLSRGDAWSEVSRLLKLCRVRLRITPNPFTGGLPFRQELDLRNGRMVLHGGRRGDETTVTVWVDPDMPVAHITAASDKPAVTRAWIESWRADTRTLAGEELLSSWTMQEAPPGVSITESADVVYASDDEVVFYHRNEHSIVPLSLGLQGLAEASGCVEDPLLHRTFGGVMRGENFRSGEVAQDPGQLAGALVTRWPARGFALRIATHSAVTPDAQTWLRQARKTASRSADAALSLRNNSKHWGKFWDRSWVFIEPSPGVAKAPDLEAVNRGWALQRWMTACAGKGDFPIKFNGSIFTVEPEYTGGPKMNADWRRWGDCYWWQNTRLPYATMLAHGDFELMPSLFGFYEKAAPLARARARIYHQAEGLYFPETMTVFGTWANRDYGWKRDGHQPNEVLNLYIRHIWQPALELVDMMLDYHAHTGNRKFLEGEVLPMARDALRYFETRFGKTPDGKIRIEPTQSAETYWHGVVNDTPTVAGLHRVTARLLELQDMPRDDRQRWLALKERLPALPLETTNGITRIRPAEAFDPRRNNIENPELYAVWPFRLYGLGRPDLATGVAAFNARQARETIGWSYDSQCAALLGLTDEAARQLLLKARNSNPNHRFPAMWGPNYDWVPDQDHGASLTLTLQLMLLQSVGEKLLVCPAWPMNWNVHFKLHAPGPASVEARVRDGRVTLLNVEPKRREKDIVLPGSGGS